jgi:hypothetical protein
MSKFEIMYNEYRVLHPEVFRTPDNRDGYPPKQ